MLGKLEKSDLVNKTIKDIEISAVNMVNLIFTDGTNLELWAETAIMTPAGSIPGIFVERAGNCVDGD